MKLSVIKITVVENVERQHSAESPEGGLLKPMKLIALTESMNSPGGYFGRNLEIQKKLQVPEKHHLVQYSSSIL